MAQRRCPECGHIENEYTYFCTECGAKTEEFNDTNHSQIQQTSINQTRLQNKEIANEELTFSSNKHKTLVHNEEVENKAAVDKGLSEKTQNSHSFEQLGAESPQIQSELSFATMDEAHRGENIKSSKGFGSLKKSPIMIGMGVVIGVLVVAVIVLLKNKDNNNVAVSPTSYDEGVSYAEQFADNREDMAQEPLSSPDQSENRVSVDEVMTKQENIYEKTNGESGEKLPEKSNEESDEELPEKSNEESDEELPEKSNEESDEELFEESNEDVSKNSNDMDIINMNAEFGVSSNMEEDYSQNLNPDDYMFYNSKITDFNFWYPSGLFCSVLKDTDPFMDTYGENVETITFEGSGGSKYVFSLTKRTDNMSTEDMMEYVHKRESSSLYDESDILVGMKEDYGKIIVTGWLTSSGDYPVYDLTKVEKDYVIRMYIIIPNYTSEKDRLKKAYVIENVYRLCGYSGSTRMPRSYKEFLEDN